MRVSWCAIPLVIGGLTFGLTGPTAAYNNSRKPKAAATTPRDALESAVIGIGTEIITNRLQRVPAGALVEVAFSPKPDGQALRLVVKIIRSATKTLEVAAYEMTSKPVVVALLGAAQRGVKVMVVADGKANPHGDSASKIDFLSAGGVQVRRDSLYPIVHHKFIIADGQHLETGSFNYSAGAEHSNAENVLVLWNNPSLAALSRTRFDQPWAESVP